MTLPIPLPGALAPVRSPATGIAAALATALLAAACSGGGPAPTTFELTAPLGAVRQNPGTRQLVVAQPGAIQVLQGDRIVVRSADGTVSFLPGAQWADQLPALLQRRLVQSFENAGRAVSVAGTGVSGDAVLQWDVRFFGLSTAGSPQADVEVSARMVEAASGRIARARAFRGSAPVGSADPKSVVATLDEVSGRVFAEMVRWAAAPAIAPRPPEAAAAAAPPVDGAPAPAATASTKP